MQGKGASECRIFMSSDAGVPYLGSDELCDFESHNTTLNRSAPVPEQPDCPGFPSCARVSRKVSCRKRRSG